MIALYFDTETTGFPSPANPPEIVQIAAILESLDTGRIVGEINLIVRTHKPIPQAVIDIHHIDDAMTKQYGVAPEIADNMLALLAAKADIIVAHNYDFDYAVVSGVWPISRAVMADKSHFCTMKRGADIPGMPLNHAGQNKYPKLSEAYDFYFSEIFEGAHDAMNDVRATRKVYHEMRKPYPEEVPA